MIELTALGRTRLRYPGESFLLRRSVDEMPGEPRPRDFCAVIDTGAAASGFAARLAAAEPDVVVLTHDDNDHIAGAPRLIGALGRRAHAPQFWLPADWSYLIDALEAVDGDADPAQEQEFRSAVLEGRLTTSAPEQPVPELLSTDEPEPPGLSVSGAGARDADDWSRIAASVAEAVRGDRDMVEHFSDDSPDWSGEPEEIATRVVDRARVISDVVDGARALGSAVHWFSVDIESPTAARRQPWETSGAPGRLTFVNARPVRPPAVTRSSPRLLLYVALLTVQNRRALVPFVPPDPSAPASGAIIWSDSNGQDADVSGRSGRTPWQLTGLMSAPHHGSRSPAHRAIWVAHDRAEREQERTIRVLLSNNKHSTACSFTDVTPWERGCTICPGERATAPRQDVLAVCSQWGWRVVDNCTERGSNCSVT
ncbi:MBL fold metallo-hydrolase [Actinoplanes sp. NPDC051861]|uniref:MBL fold metallo-hydrolase n=1 Tax=Actinoplanes sp. NPDC051861 TaxID=3155170 RepID=UPI003448AB7E